MREALDLLNELNELDESVRIEAKRASELGKSVLQTVVAFANEPGLGGGYLLLGVDWKTDEKGDVVYWAAGLPDPDKTQKDLATQCASSLNTVLRPEMQVEQVNGKPVLVVFVPEVEPSQKPVYLKATGLPRGAYRRIGSTDQHCVDEDLWVLRGETQPQMGPDMMMVADATREDIDSQAVAEYRRLRVDVNPGAEELAYGDDDLLEGICALRRVDGVLRPTVAGIVLFGKTLALRRLMPALRIDYVRVAGTQWVQDADERFTTTLDVRKPLLLALKQIQNTILDDLPKGFRLHAGELQSRQEPVLPSKVIREALANATMHRSYQVHSPVQIIRYSNRIEILNPGFSLKHVADLGSPGSRVRNPAIAAVLHDLHWAETKGSGVRAMRRLSSEAGLPLPEFQSDRQRNEFKVTLFLHHLLTEDDYQWLRSLSSEPPSADEAKVLIYARETGAVDNTACRDVCGLDTLTASRVLRRLRDRRLLVKQDSGSRTYYVLATESGVPALSANPHQLHLDMSADALTQDAPAWGDYPNPPMLAPKSPHVEGEIPPELLARIAEAGGKPRQAQVRELVLALCELRPFTVVELCRVLGRSDPKELRRTYLRPLREAGLLTLLYPETEKHPHQAYVVTDAHSTDLE
ncbi:ATP-dependent DNA helicase RecG [Aquabacterium sp. NJ1]|uniref:ATP-binding protein n=1 Tax=Aquabacterium sp. NJ1 TaxID=1538295 RepID=UPI00052D1890|nr:ATP-binding protein [Aquabacterium sp. NJ1]KGM42118.1 ATP-dependent DNA helicase RecG [Aquabacterium sp. NJ1]